MNELKIFENPEFGKVRTLEIDGEPWFVGKDVAVALGYVKPENAIVTHVDGEDKTTTLIKGTGSNYKSKTTIINESGLYALIFGSKLEKAKQFKHWITSEVLPAIRKTGKYSVYDRHDSELDSQEFLAKAVLVAHDVIDKMKAENVKLHSTVMIQNQQIAELQPKASYYDIVLNCKDLVSANVIAKDYGKSAKWLNSYLHSKKIQYKQGNIWLLYQDYAECGYTCTKTHKVQSNSGDYHAKVHTYWTQKGRLFIYTLLQSDGILPVIERKEETSKLADYTKIKQTESLLTMDIGKQATLPDCL